MPRVTLTFDLPDERAELWMALRAGAYASALWDIDSQCRAALKHGDGTLSSVDLTEIRGVISDTGLQEES